MSTHFFIHFRLHGFAKQYANWANSRIQREARRLKMRRPRQHKFKPHITLFGPATTQRLKEVMVSVARTGEKHTLVPFQLGGFDQFRNTDAYWLYFKVKPSEELEQLRYDLAQILLMSDRSILKTCELYDHRPHYKFHSSIGKYDPRDKYKFERLVAFAENECTLEKFKWNKTPLFLRLLKTIKKVFFKINDESDPNIHLHLLRIVVSGKGRREYDLVLKKVLKGRDVRSRYWRRKSIEKLKELLQ